MFPSVPFVREDWPFSLPDPVLAASIQVSSVPSIMQETYLNEVYSSKF